MTNVGRQVHIFGCGGINGWRNEDNSTKIEIAWLKRFHRENRSIIFLYVGPQEFPNLGIRGGAIYVATPDPFVLVSRIHEMANCCRLRIMNHENVVVLG